MSAFIDVKYRNHREGTVDDVTLKKLILTVKVKQFFRPSEGRWVDADSAPIRFKESGHEGPERRKPFPKCVKCKKKNLKSPWLLSTVMHGVSRFCNDG